MALTRRGVALDGTPIWEVDYSGLLLTRDPAGDQWRVRIHAQSPACFSELSSYLQRHALEERVFSSRARALDAVRLALGAEPLTRARAQTVWQRESEGVYRSKNARWRLERRAKLGVLTPLLPGMMERLEAARLLSQLCLGGAQLEPGGLRRMG